MSGEGGLRLLPGQRAQVLAILNARTMPIDERIEQLTHIVLSNCERTRQDTITSIASERCFNQHSHIWFRINEHRYHESHGCMTCTRWVEHASRIRS